MFDDLTPLRRAYGVEAPAERRPASGASGSATEEAVLRQSRSALEAMVGAQDRQPTVAVLDAVLAEAARASAEALAPLAAVRALYDEPTSAANPVEAALLSQTRAAVEQAVDARPQSPSPDAVAAVLAFAASATRLAPRPDAAVEAPALAPLAIAYGLSRTSTAATDPVETALLVQTRTMLDDAPRLVVSETSVTAVLAAAASATRLAPRPDAAVEAPALAALAAAYGLPLGAGVVPDPVETALLVQTRALLNEAPAPAGPSEMTLDTVLARAASVRSEAPRDADRPASAPDREPVRATRSYRRVGAWASAAMAMVAVVFVLLPRTAVAPEPVGLTVAQSISVAEAVPSASDAVGGNIAEAQPADPQAEAVSFDPVAPAAELSAAPSARAASGPSASEPAAPRPSPRLAAPQAAASLGTLALPVAAPRTEARAVTPRPALSDAAVPATALAAADVTPPGDEAWDVQDDVRVLSLRLQELRRGNEGLAWDTPTEAFGAPTTRSAVSAPALRSVRATAPDARTRLVTPVTGDR